MDFVRVSVDVEAPDRFLVYDLVSSPQLDAQLSDAVRDLYLSRQEIESTLTRVAGGLFDDAPEGLLGDLLARIASASIPSASAGGGSRAWLSVPRNEIGEVLALLALEQVHAYVVPASRVRHKEVAGQPSRGLDVLAIDAGARVVLCEVKVSASTSSPPAVVDSATLNMHEETIRRLKNPDSILAELNWAMKHSHDHARPLILQAMIGRVDRAPIVPIVAPVLVRPAQVQQADDFGRFKTSPSDYRPSEVNFLIIRIDEDLDEFGDRIYELARTEAA